MDEFQIIDIRLRAMEIAAKFSNDIAELEENMKVVLRAISDGQATDILPCT